MQFLARAVPVLSVLLLALVVAGCGGEDVPPSTDAQAIPAAGTDTAAGGGPTGAIEPAKASALRSGVKQWIAAIESCSAGTPSGTYTGCLDATSLLASDPALASALGQASVTPGADPAMSYTVAVTLDGMTFSEERGADGSSTTSCTAPESAGCVGGTW
jgi:hypothetical protein